MIKLSIITTMYKSEMFLRKCVDSLLNQDLSSDEYEIILVNDGSPDNCLKIAQEYSKRHKNIHVISHENKGLAGARNTGLNAACGEYICFVDPDDYLLPQSFATLLDRMEKDNLDILRFNYQMVDENYCNLSKPKDALLIDYSGKVMSGEQYLAKELGYACFVWAYIYKLSIIKGNKIFFRQGDYFDDIAWLPRVFAISQRVSTIDIKRYFYLQRIGSLVNVADSQSIRLKLNGQVVLINRLTDQNNSTKSPFVKAWYKSMISKLALSLMTSYLVYSYSEFKKLIEILQGYRVFPLRIQMSTFNQSLKLCLINLSPNLFYFIFHNK